MSARGKSIKPLRKPIKIVRKKKKRSVKSGNKPKTAVEKDLPVVRVRGS